MSKHSFLLTLLIGIILILSNLQSTGVDARGRSKTKNKHSGNIEEEQQVEELEKQLEKQMTEEQKEEIRQDEIEHKERAYTAIELQYMEYLGKMDHDHQYNFVTPMKEQDSFYFSHDGWDYKLYAVWLASSADPSNAKTNGKIFIQAPDGKNKYMATKNKVDFLEIDINQEGEWKFIFSNMNGKTDIRFTFAFLTTKDQEKPMQSIEWDTVLDKDKFDDDMNKIMKDRFFNDDEDTREYILNVLYSSQQLNEYIGQRRNDFQMQYTLRKSYEKQLLRASDKQYRYLVFECIAFAALCYAQFSYIKRVLSNKLLL